MKNNFIKSPINYTGNKFRILPQIMPHFNKNIKVFVDLFCGGATVGFNVEAEKIILIDNNKHIINLLETLAKEDIDKIINEIEKKKQQIEKAANRIENISANNISDKMLISKVYKKFRLI